MLFSSLLDVPPGILLCGDLGPNILVTRHPGVTGLARSILGSSNLNTPVYQPALLYPPARVIDRVLVTEA